MRINYSREDIIIGFFIVFAVLYPFFIALLLFLEDLADKRKGLEEVRAFYTFLLGLEECSESKALELAKLMSEELSKNMGGAEGLLRTCNSYRKAYADARAEEKKVEEGEVVVELVKKEKGMTQRMLSLRLKFSGGDGELKIEKVDYEKGS